ncbi:MAG TPA: FAD-dependent oxidoreductase [Aquella sp.]|nr:FAD-dependent oxidoreductase [Aquella sp.]
MKEYKCRKYDICVIGAGAGGLSVAAAASGFGLKVALVEGHKMGGDCLNYGCVPSKSLLSSAKHYYEIKKSEQYGFESEAKSVEIKNVMAKVSEVIANIAPHDSVERFKGLGVSVYQGFGSFDKADIVKVDNQLIKAKYFVIATGSKPVIPPIPGISDVNYLTNETIFDLGETPKHLLVIGGGPIGCELAQAFLMLGIKVTLFSHSQILPKDELDLVGMLRQNMLNIGLNLYEDIKLVKLVNLGSDIGVVIEVDGVEQTITGSHLLVATGRKPDLDKLNLEAANVKYTNRGIETDECLRTTNKKIFAIGDSVGGYLFTHIASYHAGIVIRNIVFKQRAKVNYQALPWVTYTYPELAHVGLLEREAKVKYAGNITISEFEYSENDRAQAERATAGKIKLITTKNGKVLGVSILGASAGDLLYPWIDLINRGDTVKAITNNIIPYPTLGEINKQVVGEYYKPILFSRKVRWLVKFLKFF